MRFRASILLCAFYAAVTVVMAYPFSFQIADHVLGAGTDGELFMWTLAWDVHALVTRPWSIFDANIFYPHRYTLAYSENLIGSAILAAPVIWFTGSVQIAMNVVVLVATVLSALGAHLLARRLGLSVAAAILCGLVFGFSPPRLLRMSQVHMATLQWIPFGLAYLHTYLDSGRRRDLRVAAAFFSAQAVTSGHGGAFLVLAAAVLFGYRLLSGTQAAPLRRLADLGIPGALLLVPAALIYLPYQAAKATAGGAGLARKLDDWTIASSSFVTSPAHVQQFLLSRLPDWDWLRVPPDAWLFPGVLPLLLAGMAIWPSRGRHTRDGRWAYAGIFALTSWLAVGPPFGIWGWVYWMPGLNFVRMPSRFTLLGVLALAVLAAYGFDRVARHLSPARRGATACLAGVLLLSEFATMPVRSFPYQIDIPAIDRWLDTQPKPFSVVELPVPDSLNVVVREERTTHYMLHSTAHFQKTVFGYSGIQPKGYAELFELLVVFPTEEGLQKLYDLGVTYVVVHPGLWPPTDRPDAEARFERFRDWFTLVHTEGEDRVYTIRPPATK